MSSSAQLSRPSALRRFFTNPETGEVVIGQRPNALLCLHLAARTSRRLISAEPATRALSAAVAGSLAAWALLEATKGASPFRRTVGVVVLTGGVVRSVGRRRAG